MSLLDLFEGRRQLIVYHFMFGPEWEEGCDGCSMVVDNMGHPAHLNARNTTRVLVSRAPLGRQEDWEDSPEGSPQTPQHTWWQLHDEYGDHDGR